MMHLSSVKPVCYEAEIEQMPRQRLRALQEMRLAVVLQRAQRAPFFRERLATMPEEMERIPLERFQAMVPLTSKADLRTARHHAWVRDDRIAPVMVLGTSGTTGTRIALPYTRNDLLCWRTLAARTLWTNGIRRDDIVLLPVPLGLFTGGHGMLGGLLHLGCRTIPLGAATTPMMLEALNGSFGIMPTAIVTLPSHMLRLLETLPATGYDPTQCSLRVGSFGAEAWSEAARSRIANGFGLRAVDSYGIGEICGPGIAAECETTDGMHLWEDAFFMEIINPVSGQPLPDGTRGELVITPLFREALPLLRYRTGDEAAIINDPCACGRTHRRITRIAKRLDDILVITGVNVDPVDIERILYSLPWVSSEFYLEAGGENREMLNVHVELCGTPPSDPEATITEAIRRDFHVRVAVRLHQPGELERLPGKARRLR